MQWLRRVLLLLCVVLYSLMNLSIYQHVHAAKEENHACHEVHHDQQDSHHEDTCSLCFYIHVPQSVNDFSFVNIPVVHSFEIHRAYQSYIAFAKQQCILDTTNKDPPSVS